MSRLSLSIRKQIAENATADAFKDELDAVQARIHELSMSLYRALVTEEYLALMDQLPQNFFRHEQRLRVEFQQPTGCPLAVNLRFEHPVAIPADWYWVANGDSELLSLGVELYDLFEQERGVIRKRNELKESIRANLEAFGTVKRLLQTWPEMAKFLPAGVSATSESRMLPVVLIDGLNKKLQEAGVKLAEVA